MTPRRSTGAAPVTPSKTAKKAAAKRASAKTAAPRAEAVTIPRAPHKTRAAKAATAPVVARVDVPETPFERFVIEYLEARGGRVRKLGPLEYEAEYDPALAKIARRATARLVFDTERANLPRGGVFLAPGSRFGLTLTALARGDGRIMRGHLEPAPDVDAQALARAGFPVHGATIAAARTGDPRWVAQFVFHFTLTLNGGLAEQDPRAVFADPRGPHFEFLENDELLARRLAPGFPEGPVMWEEHDISRATPGESASSLWSKLVEWLNRVQETRLARWKRRCEEGRDRDLARVNDFYQTRLDEERDRRRRRSDLDEEDRATEAELKLEWNRRVKAVRARWEPSVDLRLWGIEEIARPRVPVTWTLRTPAGERTLSGEVDLAEGAPARLPCPVCGRLVGEFWWEGTRAVCRRCRGRSVRLAVVEGGESAREAGEEPKRASRGAAGPRLPRQRTRA